MKKEEIVTVEEKSEFADRMFTYEEVLKIARESVLRIGLVRPMRESIDKFIKEKL